MLIDQDKSWIKELFQQQLQQLQEQLQQHLQQHLQQQLQQHREEERLWVREQLNEHTRLFSERLEKVETTLLTEFHKWASPQDMRIRSHALAMRALDDEVESLPDRVKNLEGR